MDLERPAPTGDPRVAVPDRGRPRRVTRQAQKPDRSRTPHREAAASADAVSERTDLHRFGWRCLPAEIAPLAHTSYPVAAQTAPGVATSGWNEQWP
jgi:hypothetical protein